MKNIPLPPKVSIRIVLETPDNKVIYWQLTENVSPGDTLEFIVPKEIEVSEA